MFFIHLVKDLSLIDIHLEKLQDDTKLVLVFEKKVSIYNF